MEGDNACCTCTYTLSVLSRQNLSHVVKPTVLIHCRISTRVKGGGAGGGGSGGGGR